MCCFYCEGQKAVEELSVSLSRADSFIENGQKRSRLQTVALSQSGYSQSASLPGKKIGKGEFYYE